MVIRRITRGLGELFERGRDFLIGDPEFGEFVRIRRYSFESFLNEFFGGIYFPNIYNNRALIRGIFGLLFGINLRGSLERYVIPKQLRNDLIDELNRLLEQIPENQTTHFLNLINRILEDLDLSLISLRSNLPDTLIDNLDSLINMLQGININVARLQNIRDRINNQIQNFRNNVEQNLQKLYSLLNNPSSWRGLIGNDRRLIESFRRGIERVQEFLSTGGMIEINLDDNNLLNTIAEAFGEIGINLDFNNDDIRTALGIYQENNQNVLKINPSILYGAAPGEFLDLIEREFSKERVEGVLRDMDFRRRVTETISNEEDMLPDNVRLRIIENYHQILNTVLQIEKNFREIYEKFSTGHIRAWISGKGYEGNLARNLVTLYAQWISIRKYFRQVIIPEVERIIRRKDVEPEHLNLISKALQRFSREIEMYLKISNQLKTEIDSIAPKEINNLVKRMLKAGHNILKFFSKPVSPIFSFGLGFGAGILGALVLGPWALVGWFSNIIEQNFFKEKK